MAELHIVGEWGGPGEERAARRIANDLPSTWSVVANRDVPTGSGTRQIDLIIVGRSLIFVLEEKSWGPRVEIHENYWLVKNEQRPSPYNQVQQSARVLAGRLRQMVAGFTVAAKASQKSGHLVRGHVVLSHGNLELIDDALPGKPLLGPDSVIQLANASTTLQKLDNLANPFGAELRNSIVKYLTEDLRASPLAPTGTPAPQAEVRHSPTIPPRYRYRERIARGGMGEVWLARDEFLGRDVAIKRLPIGSSDEEAAGALEREARRVAAMENHPHVVPVIDYGNDSNGFYLVMPYIRSQSLADLLRQEVRLESGRVLSIVDQLSQALEWSHQCGVVHRDLKPSNVLLDSAYGTDFVYLIDFGIAARANVTLTAFGAARGTPAYMAPERIKVPNSPGSRGISVDIYSLGCMIYEMLTGRPPFEAAEAPAMLMLHVNEPMPRSALLSSHMNDFLARVLAKDPNQRPSSALAVAAELRKKTQTSHSRAKTSDTPQGHVAVEAEANLKAQGRAQVDQGDDELCSKRRRALLAWLEKAMLEQYVDHSSQIRKIGRELIQDCPPSEANSIRLKLAAWEENKGKQPKEAERLYLELLTAGYRVALVSNNLADKSSDIQVKRELYGRAAKASEEIPDEQEQYRRAMSGLAAVEQSAGVNLWLAFYYAQSVYQNSLSQERSGAPWQQIAARQCGNALKTLGEFEEARVWYGRGQMTAPWHRVELGDLELAAGNREEAIELYRQGGEEGKVRIKEAGLEKRQGWLRRRL